MCRRHRCRTACHHCRPRSAATTAVAFRWVSLHRHCDRFPFARCISLAVKELTHRAYTSSLQKVPAWLHWCGFWGACTCRAPTAPRHLLPCWRAWVRLNARAAKETRHQDACGQTKAEKNAATRQCRDSWPSKARHKRSKERHGRHGDSWPAATNETRSKASTRHGDSWPVAATSSSNPPLSGRPPNNNNNRGRPPDKRRGRGRGSPAQLAPSAGLLFLF